MDDAKAILWFRKAAEQGHAKSQFDLEVCYQFGYGTPKDYSEAYKWVNLSAAQGLARAGDSLRSLEAQMTPEQIAEGQLLSREFKLKLPQESEGTPSSPETQK
jgi:TPR repeat protein